MIISYLRNITPCKDKDKIKQPTKQPDGLIQL